MVPPEIISLLSDSEEDVPNRQKQHGVPKRLSKVDAKQPAQKSHIMTERTRPAGSARITLSTRDVDAESGPSNQAAFSPATPPRSLTVEQAIAKIKTLLPGIRHGFVVQTINQQARAQFVGGQQVLVNLDALITMLLDSGYPTDTSSSPTLKRRHEEIDSPGHSKWTSSEREPPTAEYTTEARKALFKAFPSTARPHVAETLKRNHFLFPAYKELEHEQYTHQKFKERNAKGLLPADEFSEDEDLRNFKPTLTFLDEAQNRPPWKITNLTKDELQAAMDNHRRQEKERKEREQQHRNAEAKKTAAKQKAKQAPPVTCDVCFENRPADRMGHCNNRERHTYCYYCIKTHAIDAISSNKEKVPCMETDCKDFYPNKLIKAVVDSKLYQRMERMQQDAELKDIEGIVECPFCHFKCFLESGVELKCESCSKKSCTICKKEYHWPAKNCTDAAKAKNDGGKANIRHLVEEAMSKALMRECHNCGMMLVKEGGCNHLHCQCSASMCYSCRAPNVEKHRHYGQGGCMLFSNTTEETEKEVKAAEEEAKRKIKKDHPEVTDEDLKIAMSNRVKQDDNHRKQRDHAEARGMLWHPGMPIEGGDEEMGFGGPMGGRGRFGGPMMGGPMMGGPMMGMGGPPAFGRNPFGMGGMGMPPPQVRPQELFGMAGQMGRPPRNPLHGRDFFDAVDDMRMPMPPPMPNFPGGLGGNPFDRPHGNARAADRDRLAAAAEDRRRQERRREEEDRARQEQRENDNDLLARRRQQQQARARQAQPVARQAQPGQANNPFDARPQQQQHHPAAENGWEPQRFIGPQGGNARVAPKGGIEEQKRRKK
ncbi:hypothetical protein EJ08DRAFT_657609 [Tothia fuscella]|uniref:RING-type domain-containing protein n=1 Tax=Tothia fuscella TaxID=1048955 RepID=A0A9P4NYB3_9PEZI|nr:hypothetical protein EJ08DRAFT_657609 [Tothia fuscella]